MSTRGTPSGAASAPPVSLLALMRAEFSVGKRWRRLALGLQLGAVVAGIFGTVITDDKLIWAMTLIALFALLLAYVCQLNAQHARALGEQTRRAVLLAEGLGQPIEPRREVALRLAFDRWANQLAQRSPELGQAYFAATAPTGPTRLRDYLQESVFWQTQLSKRMASYALAAVIVLGFVLLAGVLLALSSLDEQNARTTFAKALSSLIPLFVTTNAVRLWWSFQMQATALEQLDAQLEDTRSGTQPPTEAEIVRLLHEYNIQLLQAPEVPDVVYHRHRNELNRAWATRAASE
jgi:hypothetical protein